MAERRPGTAELPTADDTLELGARLGGQLRAGDVVVLAGPLGAGKTVLAKGIAAPWTSRAPSSHRHSCWRGCTAPAARAHPR
jgi:tRNA threonylcarbamoyladenosine biosynthesis protein TsaE